MPPHMRASSMMRHARWRSAADIAAAGAIARAICAAAARRYAIDIRYTPAQPSRYAPRRGKERCTVFAAIERWRACWLAAPSPLALPSPMPPPTRYAREREALLARCAPLRRYARSVDAAAQRVMRDAAQRASVSRSAAWRDASARVAAARLPMPIAITPGRLPLCCRCSMLIFAAIEPLRCSRCASAARCLLSPLIRQP